MTPDEHYEFLHVAFGLANASEYFQKTMILIFRRTDAIVYIDDILLAFDTISDGFKSLIRVLDILRRKTINISKCNFFKTQINYLGREISKDGVRPGLRKVEAVMKAEAPRDVTQVRQFLGLSGYFRKCIKDYSRKVASLTRLLCKNNPWAWGVEQENSIADIKKALSSRPILVIFNLLLETEVHTDASKIGLGAILIQKSEGRTQVVAYHSRKTNSAE